MNYTADKVKTLSTIEAIRLRPAMYIDGVGEDGLFKLDSEPVENCLDEGLIHEATYCKVNYDSVKNIMIVEDDGRGMPVEKLPDLFTKAHTGTKFDNEVYGYHGGQNGVGLKAVTALTEYLKVDVWRRGYENVKPVHGVIIFEKGVQTHYEVTEQDDSSDRHGTRMEYRTDSTIMTTDKRDISRFRKYLKLSAYINPGFTIEYTVDGKREVYCETTGISGCLDDFIIKSKKIKTLIDKICITGKEDTFDFEAYITYGPNNSGDSNIISFVNGFITPNHGKHVSSIKSGLSSALTQYIDKTNAVPKSMKELKVSGSSISDNIVMIVGVKHINAMYDGQTKETFKSMDVEGPMKTAAYNTFLNFLFDNPQQAKKIVDLAITYAKYEYERQNLKKVITQTKSTKNAFSENGVDPKKFNGCRSNDSSIKEIFIVEGDSAGGHITQIRDSEYQSLYKCRGKTMNVVKNQKDLPKELLDIIQVLNIGPPNNKNIKNLAYSKIIILTDADDDGAHISVLLLAFLYIFYIELILNGNVYVAKPPIKRITASNTSFYITNEDEFEWLMEEFIINTFELYSEKTNQKLSEGLFRAFIANCQGYDLMIKNYADSRSLDPELLELIVIFINDLLSGNYGIFEKHGYHVKRRSNNIFTFDIGYKNMTLCIDQTFLSDIYDPLFEILSKKIEITGVYLKGLRSDKEYHGTIYYLMKIMNSILGPKVSVQRYKGLGEMNPDQLKETVIDPKTRKLVRVDISDAEKAKKAIDIFLGTSDPEFKRKFYAGEVDFE